MLSRAKGSTGETAPNCSSVLAAELPPFAIVSSNEKAVLQKAAQISPSRCTSPCPDAAQSL